MKTQAEETAGGANAGAVGQAGLAAARTGNVGALGSTIAESGRRAGETLGRENQNIDIGNQKLKQQQREGALGGLEGLYGTGVSGANGALNASAANTNANTNAANESWDWATKLLDPAIEAAGTAASGTIMSSVPDQNTIPNYLRQNPLLPPNVAAVTPSVATPQALGGSPAAGSEGGMAVASSPKNPPSLVPLGGPTVVGPHRGCNERRYAACSRRSDAGRKYGYVRPAIATSGRVQPSDRAAAVGSEWRTPQPIPGVPASGRSKARGPESRFRCSKASGPCWTRAEPRNHHSGHSTSPCGTRARGRRRAESGHRGREGEGQIQIKERSGSRSGIPPRSSGGANRTEDRRAGAQDGQRRRQNCTWTRRRRAQGR